MVGDQRGAAGGLAAPVGLGVLAAMSTLSVPSDVGTRIEGLLGIAVGDERFSRYFKGHATIEYEDGRVVVGVPNGFHKDLLARQFGCELEQAARAVVGNDDVEVQWRVDPACIARLRPRTEARTTPTAPPTIPGAHTPRRARRGPAPSTSGPETIVRGPANEMALAALGRIIDPQQEGYAALFVHSACGLGKTQLLQAGIAAYARGRSPERVIFTTGERFANEYIAASHAQNLDAFRKRYRSARMVCIDDVQFVAGKTKTMQELLHTLEVLEHSGARVMLSADTHPARIPGLTPRLVSRFVAAMVVELGPPDRAMRVAIVERLALVRGLVLEPGAAAVIVDLVPGAEGQTTTTVRELQGALARIEALASLVPEAAGVGGALGVSLIRRALAPELSPRPARPVRVPAIAQCICRELGVELSDIMGRGRHKRVVLARSVTAFLSRSMTSHSYPEIGRAMNRQNHSTIVTACQRIERAIAAGEQCDAGPDLDGVRIADLVDRLRAEIAREPRP